ncbi:nuclear transport factor 2 family protein [Veronia pacifica]|uniref:Polyketide cyclase n=1 Tax=Veronia pacifica TaxID=1080227 RepID=A0A1C3EMQ7_9GAMM|nr:nuclear transport factor 2 family protein [Veronia pacifica]ODA34533.1 polyketide cyclase [Veronia pacifica]
MEPKDVVISFWQAMESNDFSRAADFLAESYVCEWPLTAEKIVGRENFIAINSAYPTNALWSFTVHKVISEGENVVTEVTVTNGERTDRAITFHTVNQNKICKQVEYWPEPYPAAQWRRQWVESL